VGVYLSTGAQLIGGEGLNHADFINTFDTDDVIDTGITVNNLPYYGLVLLALLGLGAYVALRSRRRSQSAYGREI
jgi:hypothetical protein